MDESTKAERPGDTVPIRSGWESSRTSLADARSGESSTYKLAR